MTIQMKNYDNKETGCCARFDPKLWDNKTIKWNNKLFIKDRIRSIFHIPINFGKVVDRVFKKIEEADAFPKDYIFFNDENSLWGSDYYVATTKEISGMKNTKVSGTFLTKVYEGAYKDMGKWVKDMQAFVKSKGKEAQKIYFYYTTCPKCAKTFGKNYVVLLAKVE